MSDDISTAATVTIIGIMLLGFVVFGLVFGYLDYRIDNGKQAACEDAFGPDAEWVGLTSDLNGVICETPDGELHAHDTLGEPQGTFVGFLQSFGEASA